MFVIKEQRRGSWCWRPSIGAQRALFKRPRTKRRYCVDGSNQSTGPLR